MVLTKTFPTYLKDKIKYFYSIQGHVSQMQESVHRTLPDGTLELQVNLGDPIFKSIDGTNWTAGSPTMVTGLYRDKSFFRYTGKIHLVGAVINTGYASLFVNDSLEHFSQCLYSADLIFDKVKEPIGDNIYDFKTEKEKHCYLEKIMMQQFKECHNETNLKRITNAVQLIRQFKGDVDVSFLCNSVFMSERNFRRNFHELVGLSAKQYANIIRVKSFIKKHKLTGSSFMDLVYDLGYTDQSHLIRDFKHIAGISPSEFFAKLNPLDSLFIHSPQQ